MEAQRRRAGLDRLLIALLACAAAALPACGGGDDESKTNTATTAAATPAAADPSLLRPEGRPLRPRVVEVRRAGGIVVRGITFTAGRGDERVPAALATPARGPVRACLVYQGGIGSTLAQARPVWEAAAQLGVATFTIEMPSHGRRDSGGELDRARDDAGAFAALLRGIVLDVRRGLDALVQQPACRGKRIGYLGESLGGFAGTLAAAVDKRIAATVLLVVGGDWRLMADAPVPVLNFRLNAATLRALGPYDPVLWVGRIAPRPLLMINGREDQTVPLAAAERLHRAARRPKEVMLYDGGHDPFAAGSYDLVMDRIAAFLQRRLIGG